MADDTQSEQATPQESHGEEAGAGLGLAGRSMRWARAHWRPLAGAGGLLAMLLVVGAGIWVQSRGDDTPPLQAEAVVISPEGTEVPRLSPLTVSFAAMPEQRDGSRLIALEPAVPGAYAWVDDHTLLFQPEFPGWQRGEAYTVRVDGAQAGLDADVTRTFEVEGKLTVQSVIPAAGDTNVPGEAQLLVQFSRSVAPLTVLDAQDTSPVVEFDPPLPGAGEWLNTSLYRFIPDEIAPSTTYRLRIPAGLTSATDGVLEADHEWSFTTYGPALSSSDPADGTKFVGRNRPVVLTFNQPMDRASVEAGIEVAGPDGLVTGGFTWSEGDAVATFVPSQPLELSSSYEVVIPAGLRGAAGGTTEEERRLEFTTSDMPEIVRSSPRDGDQRAGRYGVQIAFNNPIDVESLEDRLTISGIAPEEMRFESYDDLEVYVQVGFEPSTTYTVTIADGVTDRDGLPLGPQVFTFTTGELEPSISFAVPSQVSTYSASAEQVLYFHATNLDAASFALYRLTDAEAGRILRDGYITPSPSTRPWRPSSDPIREWTLPIDAEPNTVALASTVFAEGGGSLPKGDYYVLSDSGAWGSQLAFSVVDTAVVTKLSQDELLVWALDYDTGEPLASVNIRAEGFGLSTANATTDAEGLASFGVPSPINFQGQEREYLVRVDDGDRRGLGSTRWVQGAEPWQLGLPIEYPREFVGHLYTDRPGETVEFKGVIREDDDATYHLPEPGERFDLVIRDPQYEELSQQQVTPNDYGTVAVSFALPEGASTGGYVVELGRPGLGGNYDYIAGTRFTVAEFRVPEFEVTAAADRAHYLDGETIKGSAIAEFYFGGPVAGAEVEWSVLASPASIAVPGFEHYSFADYDFYQQAELSEPLRAEGTTETGEDGVARFDVAAALKADEGTQRFELSTTVMDENAQAVASSTAVTVHPADYYAGIAPAEYLARTGAAATLNLVTVDTEGNLLPGREVVVRVYEREWITTKEETSGGARRYRSEPRDTLVDTLSATTGDDAEASVEYTPTGPGTLRLVAEATDADGRVARSATYLWVAGEGFASWRVRNDDVIELVADRDQYQVGDTAEVLVPTSFEGATGLVTIERGKVLSRTTLVFETTSETLRIPIEEAHVPNAFVSVVLYRPPTEADPLPRYHVGYVELPVSTETRELDVSLTTSVEQAEPGETVTYEVQVTDSEGQGTQAELSLAVVDQAVLSLADEVGPDGLGAFWYQRGLGVVTASSLAVSVDRANDVISEPEQGGKGGGGEDALRQEFRHTAHWAAQVETDAEGRASIDVALPDNLTTWRAQARAVSGDTMVGEATSELLVTKPLLLRPALPRFLRVGDETVLRVLLRNGTNVEHDVAVSIDAQGLEVSGQPTQTKSVAPGESEFFEWPASASAAGTAQLTFNADTGLLKDAVRLELPVHLDVTPETTATGGTVTDEAKSEAVYLPDFALTEGGQLEVSVQGSLVGVLDRELAAYYPVTPWDTIDHIASRLMATIAVRQSTDSEWSADSVVRGDVARLVSAQRGDGGWGWCSRCETDIDMTGWVLVALGEARAAGVEVDANVVSRARGLVTAHINRRTDVERPADPNQHAFLLYAAELASRETGGDSGATEIGFGRTSETLAGMMRSMVAQRRDELTNWGRAYLLLGLRGADGDASEEEIRVLLNDLAAATIPSANGNHWEDEQPDRRPWGRGLHTNLRTTALVLEAIAAADPEHPLIEETARWLVSARTAEDWETHVERAQAVRALGAYAEGTGELSAEYDYLVRLDDTALLEGHVSGGSVSAEREDIPLSELTPVGISRLAFSRQATGTGRLYYGLNLRYLTPATEVEALNRGFALSHAYTALDAPDVRVESAGLGDIVRVTLTVVAPADRKFAVIEDFLPAGLEPIDPQLAIVSPDLRRQLEEERQEALLGDDAPEYFAPWYAWYLNPWDQVDVRDDRLTLFADDLPKGVHEYVYFARATTPGDYFVAPAHAQESYFPEVFGRSDSGRFTVR
ncbi:MAG: hypothetical protein GEU80_12290 [Dehalococcoidia bacterium]|nr:hypothetical protein [Dehalococcoidia bacterium]